MNENRGASSAIAGTKNGTVKAVEIRNRRVHVDQLGAGRQERLLSAQAPFSQGGRLPVSVCTISGCRGQAPSTHSVSASNCYCCRSSFRENSSGSGEIYSNNLPSRNNRFYFRNRIFRRRSDFSITVSHFCRRRNSRRQALFLRRKGFLPLSAFHYCPCFHVLFLFP